MSASSIVQYGPAMYSVKSTTLIPASGSVMAASYANEGNVATDEPTAMLVRPAYRSCPGSCSLFPQNYD